MHIFFFPEGADLDWGELEASVASTDGGKRELQLLRSTFLDVQQKLDDMTKVQLPAAPRKLLHACYGLQSNHLETQLLHGTWCGCSAATGQR